MKKLIFILILGVMATVGNSQTVGKKYVIDSVYNYPDVRNEVYSANTANVEAIFSIIEEHSYMDLIYKKDTIHFRALGTLSSPPQEDSVFYMQRYKIKNTSTNKEYILNLMFYTKSDELTAIGIVNGYSLTMFSVIQ